MSDEHEPSTPAAEDGVQHEGGSGTAGEAVTKPGSTAAAGKAQYNVVDYGAKGDGSNDAPAITEAIKAANSGGGGIVFFPPGTYMIRKTLPVYSNIVYQGSGINATIIKLMPEEDTKGNSSDMFAGGKLKSEINSFSFQQMTLDGNSLGGNGIHVHGFGYTIFNVVVRNFAVKGIASSHDPSDDSDPFGVDGPSAMIVTTKVHTCTGGGIYWNGPHDSMFTNVIVYQNGPSSKSSTIGIETTSWGTGLVAVGCHVWGKNHKHAWKLGGAGTLTGCQGEGALHTQLVILANACEVIGGSFYAAGSNNDQVYGIQIGTKDSKNGVAGTMIQTKIINCLSGAVNFANDGGLGVIQPHVYQTSGSAFINTPSDTNVIGLALNGGALNGITGTNAPYVCLPGVLALNNYESAKDSPGTLIKKFPVYNSSGELLGYVPLYKDSE